MNFINSLFIFFFITLSFVQLSSAHSFLSDPEPYYHVFKTKNCRGSQCDQACPDIQRPGRMENSESNPEKTWRRGDKINIKWARNNHRGGIVRFSIVPIDQMMSRSAHSKYFIYAGCWDQGEYRCSGKLCGSDTDRIGFSRDIEIPKVIPDGVYIFAYVWFGGLHFSRKRGDFADYYSCAYVRISGGSMESSYQPTWEAGITGKYEAGGKCHTDADEPNTCSPRTGCKGTATTAVYRPFKDGNIPPVLTPGDYGGSALESRSNNNNDEDNTVVPVDASDMSGMDMVMDGGICQGEVCCKASCGGCGGSDCAKLPGGTENCCYGYIKRNAPSCNDSAPPCRRS